MILFIFFYSIKLSWRNPAFYSSTSALILALLFLFFVPRNEEAMSRVTNIINPNVLTMEGGVAARKMLWEKAMAAGNDNFPIGTGLGGYNTEQILGMNNMDFKYPHNIIFEIYGPK